MFTATGDEPFRNKAAVLHLSAPDYATPDVQHFEALMPRPQVRSGLLHTGTVLAPGGPRLHDLQAASVCIAPVHGCAESEFPTAAQHPLTGVQLNLRVCWAAVQGAVYYDVASMSSDSETEEGSGMHSQDTVSCSSVGQPEASQASPSRDTATSQQATSQQAATAAGAQQQPDHSQPSAVAAAVFGAAAVGQGNPSSKRRKATSKHS